MYTTAILGLLPNDCRAVTVDGLGLKDQELCLTAEIIANGRTSDTRDSNTMVSLTRTFRLLSMLTSHFSELDSGAMS